MSHGLAYMREPRWLAWLQRGLYIVLYAFVGRAGVAAILNLDFPAREAGWFLVASAFIALAGVSTGYYHLELIALPVMVSALGVCVVWLVIPPQMAVFAWYVVVASVAGLGLRMLSLNLLAVEARREAGL